MPNNRFWEYRFLALRDGEKCKSCGKTDAELVIDHIDGNRQNEDPANKRLLCRSCNRKNLIQLRSPVSVKEREKISVEDGVERESPELRINRDKEPIYFQWLFDNIDRPGGLTFWHAVYEGSDYCEISPITSRRYLYKKLATTLTLGAGRRGHKRIMWKTEAKPSDELKQTQTQE